VRPIHPANDGFLPLLSLLLDPQLLIRGLKPLKHDVVVLGVVPGRVHDRGASLVATLATTLGIDLQRIVAT
jgi:methanogenic corrinoid protein MtbC1